MGKFVIFCAAEFDELLEPLDPADYLLAADGGLRHLDQLNLEPQGILGDFDSLGYTPQRAEVFPVEKDDTDAMLAARKVWSWDIGSFCSTAHWMDPVLTIRWPISRLSSSWRITVPGATWWDGTIW